MPLRTSFHSLGTVLAVVLAAVLTGCSGSHEPGATVKGKVLLPGGKPLTTGLVIFHPDARKKNPAKHEARGKINDQGEYVLSSDALGQEGVPPGWYRVTVLATTKESTKDFKKEYAVPKTLIPRRYASVGTSGLSFAVKEKAPSGTYDIKLVP